MLRRLRQIGSVLLRHGLGDVAEQLALRPSPAFFSRWFFSRRAARHPATRPQRLREALEELGPTFIKFGQAISARTDLLPPDYVRELSRLQDMAPPLPPGQAEAVVESELGRPISTVFARFDPEPLGSASIAQVHRAVLVSGEEVAVKVRRPAVATRIEGNLSVLRALATLAARHVPDIALYDPVGLVEQFDRTIRREQDLSREARLVERFARNAEGDATVRFPKVYLELTTPAVLTQERLDGLKLSRVLDACPPEVDRALVARRGADLLLRQVIVDGLFHADPHPGNVLVLPDNVIGLIDFGIIGRADDRLRRALASLVAAVAQYDGTAVAKIVLATAPPARAVDAGVFHDDIQELLDFYAGARLGDVTFAAVARDVTQLVRRHHLRLPANLLLLFKALTTIEGVGRQLDPSFVMMEHASRFAAELTKLRSAPAEVAARVRDTARDASELLETLPRHLVDVLERAAGDQLHLKLVQPDTHELARRIEGAAGRLTVGLIVSALIVGAGLLAASGSALEPELQTWVLVALALAVGLGLGIVTRLHRRTD